MPEDRAAFCKEKSIPAQVSFVPGLRKGLPGKAGGVLRMWASALTPGTRFFLPSQLEPPCLSPARHLSSTGILLFGGDAFSLHTGTELGQRPRQCPWPGASLVAAHYPLPPHIRAAPSIRKSRAVINLGVARCPEPVS